MRGFLRERLRLSAGAAHKLESPCRATGTSTSAGCPTLRFLKGGIPRLSPARDFLLTPAAPSFIECTDDPHHPPFSQRARKGWGTRRSGAWTGHPPRVPLRLSSCVVSGKGSSSCTLASFSVVALCPGGFQLNIPGRPRLAGHFRKGEFEANAGSFLEFIPSDPPQGGLVQEKSYVLVVLNKAKTLFSRYNH